MRRKSLGWIFLMLLFGAFIGSALGEVLAFALPAGVVKDFFIRAAHFSVGPATLNLIVFTFTIGFSFKINIISVIGIGIAAYFLRYAQ